jgi:serine/threonine protein kinase
MVKEKLGEVKLVVILASKSYGQRTQREYDTGHELRLILDTKTDFVVVKMCDEWAEGLEEHWFDSHVMMHTRWLPGGKNHFKIVGELISKLDLLPEAMMQFDPGNFEILQKVGQGSFGIVFEARQLLATAGSPEAVAFKQLLCGFAFQGPALQQARNEMNLLMDLKHLNIVRVWCCCTDFAARDRNNREVGVGYVMELTEKGDLRKSIESNDSSWAFLERLHIFRDVAAGLEYLHSRTKPVLHRDLKSANVLLFNRRDGSPLAKLCDFGVSSIMSTVTQSTPNAQVGTPLWMAPELITRSEKVYKQSADVYSLSMIGYELATLGLPTWGNDPNEPAPTRDDLWAIHKNGEKPVLRDRCTKNCPEFFKNIVEYAWVADPSQRPTAKDIRAKVDGHAQEVRAKLDVHTHPIPFASLSLSPSVS